MAYWTAIGIRDKWHCELQYRGNICIYFTCCLETAITAYSRQIKIDVLPVGVISFKFWGQLLEMDA